MNRLGASEIPTRSSISIDKSLDCFLFMSVWIINCSTIWSPILIAGAKLAIGSWKIIETAPPRTTCISRDVRRDITSTVSSSRVNVILVLSP